MEFNDPTISQTLAAMRNEQPPKTAEQQRFDAALRDGQNDYLEQVANERRPIEQAVEQSAADLAGKTLQQSWHDRQTAPAARANDETESKENQGQPEYDVVATAKELGLDPAQLKKLGIGSHADMRSFVASTLPKLSGIVSDHELHAVLTSNEIDGKSLSDRIVAEIDRARDPQFGRSGERTPEQQANAQLLVNETLKHAIGMQKLGLAVPPVETMLKRARLLLSPHYTPGVANSTAQRLESRAFKNIHEQALACPY
jgi:hypothetical protein